MLPLGDAWSGLCEADANAPWEPGPDTLYPLCNLGYARARCPHFPEGDGPDAVRFAIREARGAALEVAYVVERDHLPYAHGTFECTADAEFRPTPEPAGVTRLARAYVSSYFRRRQEAPAR